MTITEALHLYERMRTASEVALLQGILLELYEADEHRAWFAYGEAMSMLMGAMFLVPKKYGELP